MVHFHLPLFKGCGNADIYPASKRRLFWSFCALMRSASGRLKQALSFKNYVLNRLLPERVAPFYSSVAGYRDGRLIGVYCTLALLLKLNAIACFVRFISVQQYPASSRYSGRHRHAGFIESTPCNQCIGPLANPIRFVFTTVQRRPCPVH